jgi:hypothetical protein
MKGMMMKETQLPEHAARVVREMMDEITLRKIEVQKLEDGLNAVTEVYGVQIETPPITRSAKRTGRPVDVLERVDKMDKMDAVDEVGMMSRMPKAARWPGFVEGFKPHPSPLPIAPVTPQRGEGETAHTGRAPSADTVRAIVVIRKLPEPLTCQAVSVNAQMDKKAAGNLLCKLEAKGWLASTGRGQYERTKAFPESV